MKIRAPYIVLLLVFVVLGVYYPSLFLPYNSVDDERMVFHLINTDHFSFKDIFLPGGSGFYYRPLLYLTFIADKYWWGLHESFMHLENILLHAVNVVLVFLAATRVQQSDKAKCGVTAFAAALLFALHPINSEAVNWISGRTDVLAGTFVLLSVFLLIHGLNMNNIFFGALAATSYFVGCFAKETAVFLFPAAVVLILFHDATSAFNPSTILESVRRRCAFYGFFMASCLLYLYVRHLAFARGDNGVSLAAKGVIGAHSTILHTVKIFAKTCGFYVKKLFFPFPLNFGIVRVSDYYIILGLILFVIVMCLLWRGNIITSFFVASFIIGSSAFLVAISGMAWTPIAERYMYIPCATFAIASAFSVASFARKHSLQSGLVVLVPLFFAASAYATVARNIIWQDNLTLFQDTVRKSPEFETAKNDLGNALIAKGRRAEGLTVLNSMESTSTPSSYNDFVFLNKARVLLSEGHPEEARDLLLNKLGDNTKLYEEFVRLLVTVDLKRIQATKDRSEISKIREEIIELHVKLQVRTSDPFLYYRIGQLYLNNGNKSDAQKYFAKAYEASPETAYYKSAAKKLAEKLRQ